MKVPQCDFCRLQFHPAEVDLHFERVTADWLGELEIYDVCPACRTKLENFVKGMKPPPRKTGGAT